MIPNTGECDIETEDNGRKTGYVSIGRESKKSNGNLVFCF